VIYLDVSLKEWLQFFGVSVAECPLAIYFDKQEDEKEKKYKFSSDGDRLIWTKVQRFIQDVVAGKIEVIFAIF